MIGLLLGVFFSLRISNDSYYHNIITLMIQNIIFGFPLPNLNFLYDHGVPGGLILALMSLVVEDEIEGCAMW